MNIGNLRNLGSAALHTLRRGSTTERLIVGTILAGVAFSTAQRIYSLFVYFFFTKSQAPVLAPARPPADPAVAERIQQQTEAAYPLLHAPLAGQAAAAVHEPARIVEQQQRSYSLITSIIIRGNQVADAALADALFAYWELKTHPKLIDDSDFFNFLAEKFDPEQGGWPGDLIYQKPNQPEDQPQEKITVPAEYTALFAPVHASLARVNLSLKNVSRAEQPIAKAKIRDESEKEIFDLADLYQTVECQGPHILNPLEIKNEEREIEKAKNEIHRYRIDIINITLSALRTIFIDELVRSAPKKHEYLFSLFGNEDDLRFAMANVFWHVLDRALESLESTVVPTREKIQKIQRIDLEARLVKIFTDEGKRKQALDHLNKVLTEEQPQAIEALVRLLLDEGQNKERVALAKKLQQPKSELEKESAKQELSRLQSLQTFYRNSKLGVSVLDAGKEALNANGNGGHPLPEIGRKLVQPPAEDLMASIYAPRTYARQIAELGDAVLESGKSGVKQVAFQQWQAAMTTLDSELDKIPEAYKPLRDHIIGSGWVGMGESPHLIYLTGHQRWLITKKMILQKVLAEGLAQKGNALLDAVGRSAGSLMKTLHGRFATALLAFDRATREAGERKRAKPADKIADALFNSILECYQALKKAKENAANLSGMREEAVVNGFKIHPDALNTPAYDNAFLGERIIKLLLIIRPDGLSADIKKALKSALRQGGSMQSLTLRISEMLNNKSLTKAAPWVTSAGEIFLQVLLIILKNQSTEHIATQMSDWLDPIHINASLVDFLKEDKTEIVLTPNASKKDQRYWYQEDDQAYNNLLERQFRCNIVVATLEARIKDLIAQKSPIERIRAELILIKTELADINRELLPLLLRRIIIANKLPYLITGYVIQFANDLIELLQYPRILRHIIFKVVEESIQSLAQPLREHQAVPFLNGEINPAAEPVVDFLFSDELKGKLGDHIVGLFSNMEAAANTGSMFTWIAQTAANRFAAGGLVTYILPPGGFVFSKIQQVVQGLIVKNNQNDPAVIRWNGAKLIEMLNGKLHLFAQDQSQEGMKEVVARQLAKLVEPVPEPEKKPSAERPLV